jgi:membrane protein YdbS with pleckstrin-like domain
MKRLHPRVQVAWTARAAVVAAVLTAVTAAAALFFDRPLWLAGAVGAVALVGGVALALLRYRLWRYEVRDDSLYLERGVLTRVRTVVPFVRVQHVDSARSPLQRVLGLASVVVYTAGSRGADVSVPGLAPDDADDLRERLKRLTIDAEGDDAV